MDSGAGNKCKKSGLGFVQVDPLEFYLRSHSGEEIMQTQPINVTLQLLRKGIVWATLVNREAVNL